MPAYYRYIAPYYAYTPAITYTYSYLYAVGSKKQGISYVYLWSDDSPAGAIFRFQGVYYWHTAEVEYTWHGDSIGYGIATYEFWWSLYAMGGYKSKHYKITYHSFVNASYSQFKSEESIGDSWFNLNDRWFEEVPTCQNIYSWWDGAAYANKTVTLTPAYYAYTAPKYYYKAPIRYTILHYRYSELD